MLAIVRVRVVAGALHARDRAQKLVLEERLEIGSDPRERQGRDLIDEHHVVEDEVVDVADVFATRGAGFEVEDIACRFQLMLRLDEHTLGSRRLARG